MYAPFLVAAVQAVLFVASGAPAHLDAALRLQGLPDKFRPLEDLGARTAARDSRGPRAGPAAGLDAGVLPGSAARRDQPPRAAAARGRRGPPGGAGWPAQRRAQVAILPRYPLRAAWRGVAGGARAERAPLSSHSAWSHMLDGPCASKQARQHPATWTVIPLPLEACLPLHMHER